MFKHGGLLNVPIMVSLLLQVATLAFNSAGTLLASGSLDSGCSAALVPACS